MDDISQLSPFVAVVACLAGSWFGTQWASSFWFFLMSQELVSPGATLEEIAAFREAQQLYRHYFWRAVWYIPLLAFSPRVVGFLLVAGLFAGGLGRLALELFGFYIFLADDEEDD